MMVVNLGGQGFQKFQIPVCQWQWLAGVGVEHNWESGSELLVPTLRCGKLGVQHGDCPEAREWLNGCQEVQGFCMVQGIYWIVSWKVVSYRRIEPWHKHGFQSWIPGPVVIGNQRKFGINIEHWQCCVWVVGVACQDLWQSHKHALMQSHALDELWGSDDNPCWKRRV